LDRDVGGDEPVFIGVRRFQLFEQKASDSRRLLVFFLILRESNERQTEQDKSDDRLHNGLRNDAEVYLDKAWKSVISDTSVRTNGGKSLVVGSSNAHVSKPRSVGQTVLLLFRTY
jgi:hypothetical protein